MNKNRLILYAITIIVGCLVLLGWYQAWLDAYYNLGETMQLKHWIGLYLIISAPSFIMIRFFNSIYKAEINLIRILAMTVISPFIIIGLFINILFSTLYFKIFIYLIIFLFFLFASKNSDVSQEEHA